MTLSRNHLLRAWPLLLIFASGCGKDTTTSATTTTTSTGTVTMTPSPATVIVSASREAAYAWSGAFTVSISNTNSVPITLKSITGDLQQSSGGIAITPAVGTDESFRFDVRAPGNRIDTNGNMTVPFTFFYSLPNGGRESIVTLTLAFTTDSGGTGTATATVSFQ